MAAASGAVLLKPLSPLTSMADEDATPPGMSIARWGAEMVADSGLESVARRLTQEALANLGGVGRFVGKGDLVWIKPNIGWNRAPKLAANTNPHVVAALVRLCLEAGAKKVKVGDNSCHKARQCYPRSGIAEAVKAAGGEMVYLDERRFKEAKIGGDRLTTWPVYPEILDSDLVVNVPVAKHHGLSRVSLGMKNLMGVIGGRRNVWHQDLPACLCDITAFMKPRLTVLDATRVLTANGPQGGNTADVKRLDTVAASTDIVALDAFGAELLGHEPAAIETVRAAHEAGLGQIDYRGLEVREVVVS
jgi:uncharacterized protein (DUF362 family)